MDSIDDDTCLLCTKTEDLNERPLVIDVRVVGMIRLCDEHDIDDGQENRFAITLET